MCTGSEIRIQEEGMGIGVKMTGDIAKGVMTRWDKQFNNKQISINKLKIDQ